MRPRQFLVAIACAAACGIAVPPMHAQDAQTQNPSQQQGRGQGQQRSPSQGVPAQPDRRLPPDAISQHAVELPGRTLKFTATAGSIPLANSEGRLLAEFGYVAYTLAGSDPGSRPVTFAFNGGPGSASAWLHLGGLGPWRISLDSREPSPSSRPVLVPNAETFLDFTDLVFLDPIGTGYSHVVPAPQSQPGSAGPSPGQSGGGGGRQAGNRESGGTRYYWSVEGDAESVAEAIRGWLQKNGRLASPKLVLGESYGGIRGPKVASLLQTRFGVGINGLVLVSPVLDYGIRGSWRGASPVGLVSVLPSLAASALEAKDNVTVLDRKLLAAAEDYARGDYLLDLMRGPNDQAALDRITQRVATLTGLTENVVRLYGARIDSFIFRREANRATGRMASIYDSSVRSWDPEPTSYFPASNEDPFTTGYAAPVTSAMLDLYAGRLGYRPSSTYEMSNRQALRDWVYPNNPYAMSSTGELRSVLAQDPKLKVLVAHGFTDTITPYFGSELALTQIPVYGDPARLKLAVYPGGHMFYSREASRKAFRAEVAKILE